MSTKTIGFPANPSVDDEHQGWIWDGDKWVYTAVDGGSIQDGDTQGQITTWDGTEWTPDSAVVVDGDNVGIGTDTPLRKLHISEDTGAAFLQVTTKDDTSSGGVLMGSSSNPTAGQVFYNHGTDSMRVVTGGEERLIIDADGNTTIDAYSLTLLGTDVNTLSLEQGYNSYISADASLWFSTANAARMQIDTNGRVDITGSLYVNGSEVGSGGGGLPDGDYTHNGKITATDFISTSDERLKDNITPVPVGLIDDIKPVSWEWKDGSGTSAGVVAQQLQSAGLGDYVHENEDGQLGVNYQALTAILLAEVINLKAEVEALK